MKASVTTQVTIAAKPGTVFKYLTDLKYHYLWNPQLQSISTTEKLKLGTQYETTSLVLGVKIKACNEVTQLVPNKYLELENNTGTVHYKASFKLSPKGSSTVVICETTVSSQSEAFAFAKPVLKMLARRELQTDMQALKIAVENQLQ